MYHVHVCELRIPCRRLSCPALFRLEVSASAQRGVGKLTRLQHAITCQSNAPHALFGAAANNAWFQWHVCGAVATIIFERCMPPAHRSICRCERAQLSTIRIDTFTPIHWSGHKRISSVYCERPTYCTKASECESVLNAYRTMPQGPQKGPACGCTFCSTLPHEHTNILGATDNSREALCPVQ